MANGWIVRIHPIASVVATSTAVGTPSNVANDYAGVVWRSATGDAVTLLADLGRDVPVDTLLMFGVNGDFVDGSQLTVVLATAAQGDGFTGSNVDTGAGAGNYRTVSVEPTLTGDRPASGRGVSIASWSTPHTARYVYARVTGLTSAGALQIARLVPGRRLQLVRNFGNGGSTGIRDLGGLDYSARGVMLRRRSAKLRTLALTFSSIHKDEVEGQITPLFEYVGNTELVAIVTDPAVDAQRQSRCWLGPLVGELSTVRRNAAAYEAKVALVSNF